MYTNEEVAEKFGNVVLEFQSLYKGCASYRGTVITPNEPPVLIEAAVGECTYEAAYELCLNQLEKLEDVSKWSDIKITEGTEVVFDYTVVRW